MESTTAKVIILGRGRPRVQQILPEAVEKERRCTHDSRVPLKLLQLFPLDGPISAQNSNHSPFLCELPQEIRSLIYEYVLGQRSISFEEVLCHDGCHPSRYRCQATICNSSDIWFGQPHEQSSCASGEVPEMYSTRKLMDDINLHMLLTCRQIYNEARLVPFKDNEFGFSDDKIRPERGPAEGDQEGPWLQPLLFLRDLVPDQSRSINSLYLSSSMMDTLMERDIEALPNLKRLRLRLDWYVRGVELPLQQLVKTLDGHFTSSGIEMFAKLRLESVEIALKLKVLWTIVESVKLMREDIITWVDGKQKRLLRVGQRAIKQDQANRST